MKFEHKAAKKKGKLIKFLKKLDKLVPEDMQDVVKEEDAIVWKDIDCLECANCCKTMTPTYNPKDIKRIAAHFDMTPKEFKTKWLYKDDNGDWMNTSTPCQFLGVIINAPFMKYARQTVQFFRIIAKSVSIYITILT